MKPNLSGKILIGQLLVVEVDESFELEEGDVIVQVAGIVLRMDEDGNDVLLDLRIKFRLAVHVPLTQTNAQLKWLISKNLKN